jgi:hypothetical protein
VATAGELLFDAATQRAARWSRAAADSGADSRRLVVLALAETTLSVLLGVVLAEFLLALAEAPDVLLLGVRLVALFLALAEAASAVVFGESLRIGLTLREARPGLLGIRRPPGIFGHRLLFLL